MDNKIACCCENFHASKKDDVRCEEVCRKVDAPPKEESKLKKILAFLKGGNK